MLANNAGYISSIIPATAIVAIILFIAREISDYFKKRRIDIRKRQAINSILLALCQRNLWVIEQIHQFSGLVDTAIKSNQPFEASISEINNNFLEHRIESQNGWRGGQIYPIQIAQVEKILLEAAVLDTAYFSLIVKAHDSILEIEHLRFSLKRYLELWNAHKDKYLLEQFYVYANKEYEKIKENLNNLGAACGGDRPLKPRVR